MMATASASFHGRATELTRLTTALDEVRSGRSARALIEGEPGIGKTRLLSEGLRRSELRAFIGQARELEHARPFGAIAEALACVPASPDPLRSELGRLIGADIGSPAPDGADPGVQFRVIEGFARLVEEEALTEPLALVIEDLHWADPSTILTLRTLVRRLTTAPVALIGTLRPLPKTQDLDALLETMVDTGTVHVQLGPLIPTEATGLIVDTVGSPVGASLRDLVRGAAGNPLYIIELTEALLRTGAIDVSEGRAELRDTDLPPTLRQTILHRVGFLPAPTLATLRTASLLGSMFSVADLAVISAQPTISAYTTLRDALTAGVLEEEGARLRFRHDLIRDALYEQIPEPDRAALHRDAAQRLIDAGAPVLQVAEHVLRGATSGDEQAVDWLTQAAREAAPRSPLTAADLLEGAISLLESGSETRDRLEVERINNLFLSGKVREAVRQGREVLPLLREPSSQAALRSVLQIGLTAEGRSAEALPEAELALASPDLAPGERARLLARGAANRFFLGDLEGALEWARSARDVATAVGDHQTICESLCAIAGVHHFRSEFTEGLRVAREAVAEADRSPGRVAYRFLVSVFLGNFLLDLDRISEGIETIQRGIRITEEIGARWNLPVHQVGLTTGHYFAGRWDDSVAEFETAVDLADEMAVHQTMMAMRAVRAMIALHRGDLGLAEDMVTAAERDFAEMGPQYRFVWVMCARALLLEASGSLEQARDLLSTAWGLCTAVEARVDYPIIGPDLVRLSLATGDGSGCEDVARSVEEIASRERAPWLVGAALRCRGLLEGDAEILLAAVDAYRASPRVLDRAQACEDAAAALAHEDKHDDAPRLLEEALDLYTSLDAVRDVARIEATTDFRRTRRKRPATGWESLTDSEARVVELVAEGLSNPQVADRLFVSPRTVQTHLRHIFAKLGITSRVELAARSARRR